MLFRFDPQWIKHVYIKRFINQGSIRTSFCHQNTSQRRLHKSIKLNRPNREPFEQDQRKVPEKSIGSTE